MPFDVSYSTVDQLTLPHSSVLTTPTYLAGVRDGVDAATGGGCIAVDPFTLGYLARVALGGTNNNRVSYVWDDLPRTARAGSSLFFTATVRNDGWNVLGSVDHDFVASIYRIELIRRPKLAKQTVGAAQLNIAGSPFRQSLRRQGYTLVCNLVSRITAPTIITYTQ